MKWLRRAGLLLAGVFAVVGTAAAVGLTLPETHRATSTIELAVPPARVFERIRDVAAGADWRPSVDRVEMLGDSSAHQRFREYSHTGPLTMEIVEVDAPTRMATRIADPDLPFGGSWTWQIEPTAEGSRITIEEDGVIHNPLFRVVSRFGTGYNATMETYLRDLAASFGQRGVQPTSRWSH